MTLNWKDFLRKAQFPLLLACATLPLALILLNNFAPDCLPVLWPLSGAYILIALFCLVLPGKVRLAVGIAGAAGVMALGLYLLPAGAGILLPLMYAVLLLLGLQMGGWSRDMEIQPYWYIGGVILHIAGQILVNAEKRTGNFPIFSEASSMLMASFILFAALTLLSMNRTTMRNASMGRQRVPKLMRRRNILLTLGLLALGLFVSALPQVIQAIEKAWAWLLQVLYVIFVFISNLLPDNSSAGGSGGGAMDMSELGGEAAEPSLFALIMEKVMMVFAAAAVAVLAVFVVYKLYQKLKVLAKYLSERLSMFAHSASEDFEDEITDTRDDGEQERISVLESLRRRLIRVDEKKLSPAQRVRYRYLRLMVKHPEWHASQTARESVPQDAAALYERARYSDHDVSAEEADRFSEQVRPL